MNLVTVAVYLLFGANLVVSEYPQGYDTPNLNIRPKLWPKNNNQNNPGAYCHGPQGKEHQPPEYPWPRLQEDYREYDPEYMQDMGGDGGEVIDYQENEERPQWQKRSHSVSPYISLGALSNLPQFFEQLKGGLDRLDQHGNQPTHHQHVQTPVATAAEGERIFRPPNTAAVLHAFRNYRPLRRTRSYPPALVQG